MSDRDVVADVRARMAAAEASLTEALRANTRLLFTLPIEEAIRRESEALGRLLDEPQRGWGTGDCQ